MSDYMELIKFGRRYALYQEDGDHSDFPEKAAAAIKTLLRERDEALHDRDEALDYAQTIIETYMKERDEALARVAESEWKPIETAPKDGTWIDLWGFFEPKDYVSHYPAGRWTNMAWQENAWRLPSVFSDGRPGDSMEHIIFTHWMPLPEPPMLSDAW